MEQKGAHDGKDTPTVNATTHLKMFEMEIHAQSPDVIIAHCVRAELRCYTKYVPQCVSS